MPERRRGAAPAVEDPLEGELRRRGAGEVRATKADEVQDFAFLGREFLTWLLWQVDRGEGRRGADGDDPFDVSFAGKVRFAGLVGDVSDATLKGRAAAQGVEVRAAIGAGRTLREADLRLARGEREWSVTLVADTLDLRSARLPALLTEEEDDRFLERISLLEELDAMILAAFTEFLDERTRPAWRRTVIPAMRAWIAAGLEVS